MITYIKIDGFKSFNDFEMEFSPFTVIAGSNASGKSNLFDALKLLSRMAEVELREAFSEQRGNPKELFTQLEDGEYRSKIYFEVDVLVPRSVSDNWGGKLELNYTRLKYSVVISREENNLGLEYLSVASESLRRIKPDEDKWLKKFPEAQPFAKSLRTGGSTVPFIHTTFEGDQPTIKIRQDGGGGGKVISANSVSQTILGAITSVDFPHVLAVKEEMLSWKYLELNPEELRLPTKHEPGIKDVVSSDGKNMAAALYRMKNDDPSILFDVSRRLNSFIPNFTSVDVENDKVNEVFIIKLKDKDGKVYSSRVLSEGTLRILLLCILHYDEKFSGLICFEEPENGINPFKIKALCELLNDMRVNFLDSEVTALRQVIVNTHSPTLVGSMMLWSDDKNVSVHYAELVTRLISLDNKKMKLGVTKIIPASKANPQLDLEFSVQERALTVERIKNYLELNDTRE